MLLIGIYTKNVINANIIFEVISGTHNLIAESTAKLLQKDLNNEVQYLTMSINER